MSRWRTLVVALTCVMVGVAAQACAPQETASDVEQAVTRSLPTFEVDEGWMKVPEQWKLGDASSFAVDSGRNVWLLHRPWTLPAEDAAMAAPPIMVFDSGGNFVKALGGPGDGYDWPQREHGLHIDSEDFVWVTGNNCPTNGLPREPVADDQVLKFAPDGSFVLQIGHVGDGTASNADTENVHRAADAWVHAPTNELFVADGYGNSRIVVFDADTGAFKRMWGAFGEVPVDDATCGVVYFGDPAGPGLDAFNLVHAVAVSNDGTVYVADRENRRVQVFSTDGTYIDELIKTDTTFARGLAFSADPAQEFLYVGNGENIAIVDRATVEILGVIDVPGILGGGHQIASDAEGNIYIAQTDAGVQKLSYTGLSSAP
jgi:DNA-binding beta-propeller fold protein YncE